MTKIIKYTTVSFLLLGFFVFLPFERLLTLEVFGLTLKISYLILLLLIVFLFAQRRGEKLSLEEKILLAFAGISYLSIIWSIDQFRSMVIATIFLSVFLGFFALRYFLNQKLIEKIETIIIWSGILLSIFALWQYFADLYGLSQLTFLRGVYNKSVFGFPRPQATFLEPLYFANYLFLPLFIATKRFVISKRLSVPSLVSIFLTATAFTLTLSRGAYIGLLLSVLVLIIWSILKFKILWRKLLLSMTIVLFGVFSAVLIIKLTAPKQSFDLFVAHAGVADATSGESTLDRFYLTKKAWQESLRHPLGLGAGAFGALPEFAEKAIVGDYQTVNNLYLEILVEEGIIGFLLFAGFLFLLIKKLFSEIKKGSYEALIYFSIGVAIFAQAVTFSSLYILPIWAYLALAWRQPDH